MVYGENPKHGHFWWGKLLPGHASCNVFFQVSLRLWVSLTAWWDQVPELTEESGVEDRLETQSQEALWCRWLCSQGWVAWEPVRNLNIRFKMVLIFPLNTRTNNIKKFPIYIFSRIFTYITYYRYGAERYQWDYHSCNWLNIYWT